MNEREAREARALAELDQMVREAREPQPRRAGMPHHPDSQLEQIHIPALPDGKTVEGEVHGQAVALIILFLGAFAVTVVTGLVLLHLIMP